MASAVLTTGQFCLKKGHIHDIIVTVFHAHTTSSSSFDFQQVNYPSTYKHDWHGSYDLHKEHCNVKFDKHLELNRALILSSKVMFVI